MGISHRHCALTKVQGELRDGMTSFGLVDGPMVPRLGQKVRLPALSAILEIPTDRCKWKNCFNLSHPEPSRGTCSFSRPATQP